MADPRTDQQQPGQPPEEEHTPPGARTGPPGNGELDQEKLDEAVEQLEQPGGGH
jgi:hypothetical protein